MKKKTLVMAIVAIAAATGAKAQWYDFSAVAPTGQTLYYSSYSIDDENRAILTQPEYGWEGYAKPTGDLTIPAIVVHDGVSYTVASLGGEVFSGCSELTSVTMEDGIEEIGERAFENCSGMTSVTLPNGIGYISNYTFSGCNGLTAIVIPDGVGSIGENSFSGCTSLSSVVIPSSVTTIWDNAFNGCSRLRTIAVPSGVSHIGTGAFAGVSHVTYHGSYTQNSPWGAKFVNGVVDGDFVYTDSTKHKLMVYIGQGGAVTIAESVDTIGAEAFTNCVGLTSVAIGDGVECLMYQAFVQCSDLTTVTIGSGIVDLGSYTFSQCPNLTSVTITAENPPAF